VFFRFSVVIAACSMFHVCCCSCINWFSYIVFCFKVRSGQAERRPGQGEPTPTLHRPMRGQTDGCPARITTTRTDLSQNAIQQRALRTLKQKTMYELTLPGPSLSLAICALNAPSSASSFLILTSTDPMRVSV
jgi:hypothetical protein